jgi:hypothetical protein
MHRIRFAVLARFLVVAACAIAGCSSAMATARAAEGAPPNGVYRLMTFSGGRLIRLGTLEIREATYRVGEKKDFSPYSIDAQGKITWSAGLSFLPDGWTHQYSKFAGPDDQGRPNIRIHYKSSGGNMEVMDAIKEN